MKDIEKSKNYRVSVHSDMGYAVFKRVVNSFGSFVGWQQVTKWYQYKKYAMDYYKKHAFMEV